MQAPQQVAQGGAPLPRLNTAVSVSTNSVLLTPPVSASPPQYRSATYATATVHQYPDCPMCKQCQCKLFKRPSFKNECHLANRTYDSCHKASVAECLQGRQRSNEAWRQRLQTAHFRSPEITVAGPSTQSTHPAAYPQAHTSSPSSSSYPHIKRSFEHFGNERSSSAYNQQVNSASLSQLCYIRNIASHPRSQQPGPGQQTVAQYQHAQIRAPDQRLTQNNSYLAEFGQAPRPGLQPNLPPQHSHGMVMQRPPTREHLERRGSAQYQQSSPTFVPGGATDFAATQQRPTPASSAPQSPETSRLPMTPTAGPVLGPATPSLPQPHSSPPSNPSSNPAPPEEQKNAAPPHQNMPENRSARLLNQWDPAKHAQVTFASFGKHFAEIARVAEAHLARELGEVKAHAQQCERQLTVALAGAEAERQVAVAARAAEAEVRGNMLKAYAAATQLSGMCGGLRGQLRTAQAEVEQVRAERESLREENWQLKEVVAKLSRDVHLGERDRREGSTAVSGDALLDSALAQAREECEKRVLIERELTELKAYVSKQALLQSSVTDTSWPEIVATFPRLEESFADTQPEEQREPDNSQGERRTPPPLAGRSFTSGLATPQSQAGTVDIERAPSDRALSEVGASEVIDLTMSDDSPSPPASNGRKRSASPSLLDEESALKRRRVQELIDGPPPQAEESPPEMQPSSSSTSIHEFGVAPLLMGSPSAHEDPASLERKADPDRTLVDESGVNPASPTVPKSEPKVESHEEGEILGTPTEIKPAATLGELSRDATLPEQVPLVHQPKDEEEEDGEIKQETQAFPPLPSALTPALPIRSLPVSTVKALPASREQRPSTSSDRPLPLLAPKPPPESHALPPKPNVPPPPIPSEPPPPRPALRRTLTISHINLAYDEVGPQYTCVMCKRRHSKDPTFRVASFPKNSSWDTLAGHVEREHPMGFGRLVNMSASQIAEAISRK